ncbi:hypothetical protein LCGC14_0817530 [marine sediment metagenome]|uniref:Transmembrane protein n=1 Tax=marine sediment metagenome TaxID=412755 RepID=A0A0F9Q557_9ZZZZ
MNEEMPDTTIEGPANIYLAESWSDDIQCWPVWVDIGFMLVVVMVVVILDWWFSRS